MRKWMLAAMVLLCAALVSSGSSASAKRMPEGRFVDLPAIPSTHVAPPHISIWLPPGYDRGRKRYGVVYMQDGQNIFFNAKSGFGKAWEADKSILRLIASRQAEPVIIVAVWNAGAARGRHYYPQAIYAAAPAWAKAAADQFHKSPIVSDAYLQFLTGELKPMIDRQYRTRADRDHTTIVGASMGGLFALYAIAEYPQVFGAAGCVSTHWPLSNPVIKAAQRDEMLAVWGNYLTERLGPPAGRRIWFDHGDKTLDGFYGPWQSAIDARLVRIGWQPGSDFSTRVYPGGAHDEESWAARLDDIFGWLLAAHE